MMMLTAPFLALVLLLAHAVAAIPLTVKLGPSETQCVYTEVATPGAKIGFYFAVQSGGSFDINVSIKGPNDFVEYKEAKEKQGEFSFSVSVPGEYEFCLSNDMSTFSEKVVEFEIVDDSPRSGTDADSDLIQAALPDVKIKDADKVEAYIGQIETRANNVLKALQYYKMRNNRNQSTVKSTERRIFWFSLTDLVLMVGMAGFHVTVVHFFFNGCKYSAFLNAHLSLVLALTSLAQCQLETLLTRFHFFYLVWYSSQKCSLIKQIRKQKINLDTPILVRLWQLHADRLHIALAIGNGTAATIGRSGIFFLHNGHGGRGS